MADRDERELSDAPQRPDEPVDRRAKRRRSVDEVFGDVLPDETRDEGRSGWGERPSGSGSRDDELRRDVPPHHG